MSEIITIKNLNLWVWPKIKWLLFTGSWRLKSIKHMACQCSRLIITAGICSGTMLLDLPTFGRLPLYRSNFRSIPDFYQSSANLIKGHRFDLPMCSLHNSLTATVTTCHSPEFTCCSMITSYLNEYTQTLVQNCQSK